MKIIESNPQPQSPASASLPRSLTSTVFHLLRRSILFGQFAPGTKLSAGHLATQYKVSLSAVREALARLAAEGLVESQDHRGFRVMRVSREELLELTQARIDIECMALRRSIERGDKAWEARVTAAYEALQGTEGKPLLTDQRRYDRHLDFHLSLLEACGSEWLLRLRSILFERAERYRLLSATYPKSRREVALEHKRLYEAVLMRDADKAAALLAQHTMETTKTLLAIEKDWPRLPPCDSKRGKTKAKKKSRRPLQAIPKRTRTKAK